MSAILIHIVCIFVFLESAAHRPVVVIPDKINKWAGEDEEDDIKVCGYCDLKNSTNAVDEFCQGTPPAWLHCCPDGTCMLFKQQFICVFFVLLSALASVCDCACTVSK